MVYSIAILPISTANSTVERINLVRAGHLRLGNNSRPSSPRVDGAWASISTNPFGTVNEDLPFITRAIYRLVGAASPIVSPSCPHGAYTADVELSQKGVNKGWLCSQVHLGLPTLQTAYHMGIPRECFHYSPAVNLSCLEYIKASTVIRGENFP